MVVGRRIMRTDSFILNKCDLPLGMIAAALNIALVISISLSISAAGDREKEKGDLVAYYPLDGDAKDHSGYANHGVVHGGAAVTEGKIGQAYSFDGVDDYIDLGNPVQLQLTDKFTVSAWVQFDLAKSWYGIVSKNRWAGSKRGMHGWMLYRGETGGKAMSRQYRFTIGDGKGPQYTESSINHPDRDWHFVVAVKDGLETRIYVDGRQTGQRDLRDLSISDSGESASIGRQYSSHEKEVNGFARGKIDEVKIWNFVLSEEAIGREYLEGRQGAVR